MNMALSVSDTHNTCMQRHIYTHKQTYRYLPVYIQHLGWGSFHQTLEGGMESFCRGPVVISFHHHHQTISCNSPTSHLTECFIVIRTFIKPRGLLLSKHIINYRIQIQSTQKNIWTQDTLSRKADISYEEQSSPSIVREIRLHSLDGRDKSCLWCFVS
jgi:hypothetical protein